MLRLASLLEDTAKGLNRLGALPLLALALAGSAAWTLLGTLISLTTIGPAPFLQEWVLLQGLPLIGVGIFLSLFSQGFRLRGLSAQLGCPPGSVELGTRTRWTVLLLVTTVGTGSLVALGFPAQQPVLSFMWFTCLLICFMASLATEHAGEVLVFAARLPSCTPKLHLYSPADTPAVRKLAEYIAFFGLVISIGYSFAFVATVSGNWNGNPLLIRTVKFFWPVIYVPLCLATLMYPHVAIYRLIRNEKDRAISSLQERMAALASVETVLSNEEIDRLNALADLIQKIESTPNYPRNVSLVGSLALTLFTNLASLLVPKEALASALRNVIGF